MRCSSLLAPCVVSLAFLTACVGPASLQADADPRNGTFVPDLPVSRPPFEEVHADWKERLAVDYVYVEHVGSYTETGGLLAGLFSALKASGVEPSGPPFGLFYDDPGEVAVERLLSRACFPVNVPPGPEHGFKTDRLPVQTVVYALASGPYPELPRAYPGLLSFVGRMGWTVDGPVREIYLTPPETVTDFSKLMAEIQVPVGETL